MLDGLNDVLSEDSRTDNSCLEQFRSSTLPNRSVSTQNLASANLTNNSPMRRSLSKSKVSWNNRRSVEFLNTLHLKNNDELELESNASQIISGIRPASKSRSRPSGSNLNRSRSMTTGDLNFNHVSMVCIFGVFFRLVRQISLKFLV